MARTYIRNIGGWGAMEPKTNVDNSRRLDHLHMTQLSVLLNRLIPDSLTKPRSVLYVQTMPSDNNA
ncbi:hypothetical protein CFBP1573P_05688 [Pseudomonas syringae pv. persicae]|nr:hypothetical protein ALQ90_200254 [Pseudomonas savastanoi pv. savastanoi]SOQ15681.1 hypothetical protein CFBP1573P_05688 [Pseudomonas syringae pv. persicae]